MTDKRRTKEEEKIYKEKRKKWIMRKKPYIENIILNNKKCKNGK